MRVISSGDIEELQCECPKCKAIIGYYPYEASTVCMFEKNDLGFIPEGFLGCIKTESILCPICGHKIELGSKLY